MDSDWNAALLDQLGWHWRNQLRPRLDGLTDDEYFWQPVPGCWNVRPAADSTAGTAPGSGDYTVDFALPQPEPSAVRMPKKPTMMCASRHAIVLHIHREVIHHGAEIALLRDLYRHRD